MAVSYTRNLKLRLDPTLSANARYNLNRLDLLGGTFVVDTTNSLALRSQTDILIEPNSADIGGSGTGGTARIGTSSHSLDAIFLYGTQINLSSSAGLRDQAAGGNKYLRLLYKSDLSGSVDTTADRQLSVDLQGADRQLVFGGNLSTVGGSIVLNLGGDTNVTLPTTGTLATLDGAEVLTNKSMSGSSNSFSNIPYASLVLTGSITNSDVASGAAIAYGKLNLAGSILNSDVSPSAAIAYGKLSLGNSILNSDIANSAAIAYSKLALTGSVVNADISSSAAIARSKLASGSPDVLLVNNSLGVMSELGALDVARGGTGASNAASALNNLLPDQGGNSGKFLTTNGSSPSWASIGGVSGVAAASGDWTSGTTFNFTHGLLTEDVVVSVHDSAGNLIMVDWQVVDSNNIQLTSSESPSGTWRVTVHGEQ